MGVVLQDYSSSDFLNCHILCACELNDSSSDEDKNTYMYINDTELIIYQHKIDIIEHLSRKVPFGASVKGGAASKDCPVTKYTFPIFV